LPLLSYFAFHVLLIFFIMFPLSFCIYSFHISLYTQYITESTVMMKKYIVKYLQMYMF
jgi:hypothetical protein